MKASAAELATATPAMSAGPANPAQWSVDAKNIDHGDSGAFSAALERQQTLAGRAPVPQGESLGQVIAGRAAGLAGDVKKDQQHVSRLLEQATASGDSMQLMKAMLALNEYQLRVQTVSKVVAKAGTSVDSLTKLQ